MSAEELMELSGSSQIFDVAFHPTRDLLATALITGNIEVWKMPLNSSTEEEEEDEDESDVIMTLTHHKAACRGVQYCNDGRLLSISSDLSWVESDAEGRIIQRKTRAHEQPLNKLTLIDDNVFATGDDSGVVRLWDTRTNNHNTNHSNNRGTAGAAVMNWDAHTDFVSALQFAQNSRQLFSTAGDATLCVYDIRNNKHFYKSDDQEAELTSLCVMEDRQIVVCGTDAGTLLIFKWGLWGDCSDRFPCQTESINSLSVLRDGHTLVAGGGDGQLRAYSLYPMHSLGVLGALVEEGTVEGLTVRQTCVGHNNDTNNQNNNNSNSNRVLMAAFAYTERVVLWDLSQIEESLTAMAQAQDQKSDNSECDSDNNDSDKDSEDGEEDNSDDISDNNSEDSDDGKKFTLEEGEDDEEDDSDDYLEEASSSERSDGGSDEGSDGNEKDNAKTAKSVSNTSNTYSNSGSSGSNTNSNNRKRALPAEETKAVDASTDKKIDTKAKDNGNKTSKPAEDNKDNNKQKRLKTDSERFYADL